MPRPRRFTVPRLGPVGIGIEDLSMGLRSTSVIDGCSDVSSFLFRLGERCDNSVLLGEKLRSLVSSFALLIELVDRTGDATLGLLARSLGDETRPSSLYGESSCRECLGDSGLSAGAGSRVPSVVLGPIECFPNRIIPEPWGEGSRRGGGDLRRGERERECAIYNC
jgi:hypothetical protein